MARDPSRLGAYTSRSMAPYLVLSSPAVALEVLFAATIATSPTLAGLGFAPVVQAIPWVVAAASVFAILTFRSSLLLTLLVFGYFLEAVVAQSASFSVMGASFTPGTGAALVVISVFLALMAFGFARSARIQAGRRAEMKSSGSVLFQVLGVSLDFAVPALLAVILVLVTDEVFGTVKSTLGSLPPPLSQVFTSGLSSPFAAVAVTLIVAGVTLWVVRELVEPLVLYYSITKKDAIDILQGDLKEVAKSIELKHRTNRKGVLGTVLVIGAIGGVLYYWFGLTETLQQLPTLWGAQHPVSYPSFIAEADALYRQAETYIQSAVNLLWG